MMSGDLYSFLVSDEKSLLLHTCPNDLFAELMSIEGCTVDYDNMETNGWEWDWWCEGSYKDQKLKLSGSGFYGHAKVTKV